MNFTIVMQLSSTGSSSFLFFFSSIFKKMIFEHSISRTIPCIYRPLLFYTMARLTNHKPFPTMLSFLRRLVCTALHIFVIWFLFGIKKKKNGKNRSLFEKKIFSSKIQLSSRMRISEFQENVQVSIKHWTRSTTWLFQLIYIYKFVLISVWVRIWNFNSFSCVEHFDVRVITILTRHYLSR